MSNITKIVSTGIPSGNRYQAWNTATDLNDSSLPIAVGDIFRIGISLGKPAKRLVVNMGGAGSVQLRLNPVITVYPRRPDYEMGSYMSQTHNVVADPREYMDTSQQPIEVLANEVFIFDQEISIDTVEIVAKTGDFKLIVD